MARQNKHGIDLVLYILMGIENQLLNALASEYKYDIIEQINEELEEIQEALQYIRTKSNIKNNNQFFEIWKFAESQLNIIKAKKETSENQIEKISLALSANCIVDIMDEINNAMNT